MIATHCAPASTYANGIIYSPDMGKTWAQYDLREFGHRSRCRIHKKNTQEEQRRLVPPRFAQGLDRSRGSHVHQADAVSSPLKLVLVAFFVCL